MTTLTSDNLIASANATAARMAAIQAGGYKAARAIADERFSECTAADRHAHALLMMRDARKAARQGWVRGTVVFNGVTYGLMGGSELSYVPLFGQEIISSKELGGHSAMSAALEAAIKTANAGQWPYAPNA